MKREERVMAIINGFTAMYGFKKSDLAAICKVTPQTWSNREKDPGSFKLHELTALARSFGVTLGELMEGQGRSRE